MPELPRINPGPRGFGRQASAADFGASQGAALEQRGQAVAGAGGALGEVLESEDRIYRAHQRAKVVRAAAELAAADDEAVFSLERDPDLDTHAQRFEAGRAERLQAAQAQLPDEYRSALDDAAFASGRHALGRVRSNVERRRVEETLAAEQRANELYSGKIAHADPLEGEQIRRDRFEHLAQQRDAGVLSAAQHDALVRDLDRTASGARRGAAIAANPLGALEAMEDPASPLLRGLDAAEAEAQRERARVAYSQQLAEQRAQAGAAREAQERAEKEAGEAATRDLYDRLDANDLDGAQQVLQQNRSVLPPDRYRYGLDRIAQGDGLGAERTNPSRYLALSSAVARGEVISGELDAAVTEGEITKADRDRLLKQSQDRRFGATERFLKDALQVDDLFSQFDDEKKIRAAESMRAWADFKAQNPEATDLEGLNYARDLLRYTGVQDLSQNPPPQYSPQGAAADAAAQAAMVKAASGEISPAELAAELRRIEAMQDAQRRAGAPK